LIKNKIIYNIIIIHPQAIVETQKVFSLPFPSNWCPDLHLGISRVLGRNSYTPLLFYPKRFSKILEFTSIDTDISFEEIETI